MKGVRYFRCRNQHGVFVRHDKLIHDKKRSSNASSSSSKGAVAASKVAGKVPSTLRRSTGNLSGSPGTATAVSSSLLKPTAASAAKHKWIEMRTLASVFIIEIHFLEACWSIDGCVLRGCGRVAKKRTFYWTRIGCLAVSFFSNGAGLVMSIAPVSDNRSCDCCSSFNIRPPFSSHHHHISCWCCCRPPASARNSSLALCVSAFVYIVSGDVPSQFAADVKSKISTRAALIVNCVSCRRCESHDFVFTCVNFMIIVIIIIIYDDVISLRHVLSICACVNLSLDKCN